jgi:hypothetical protein
MIGATLLNRYRIDAALELSGADSERAHLFAGLGRRCPTGAASMSRFRLFAMPSGCIRL